jgi:hypothetical protein
MKKSKLIAMLALAGFGTSIYAAEASKASANPYEGYWVQFDEDKDAGRGKVQGIIHSEISAKDSDYGKKDTLQMSIVVPIMKVNASGSVISPVVRFQKGGDVTSVSGSINGFKYDYSSDKTNLLQGLVFSGNLQKQSDGTYDKGGVLNPNDGATYNASAKIEDGGKTLDVRAYKGSGWASVGKNAHWKKITPEQYEAVKEKCGLTADNVYPYQNNSKDAENKFKECYNYDFGVVNPTK